MRSVSAKVAVGAAAVLALAATMWRLMGPTAPPPASSSNVGAVGKVTESVATSLASKRQPMHSPLLSGLSEDLKAIAIEASEDKREEMLERFVAGISLSDLPVALDLIESRGDTELNQDLWQRLIRRWGESDPKAAADWALAKPAGQVRREAINNIAIAWASQSLTEAAKWARQLPDAGEQKEAILAVAYEAVRNEPVEGLRLAVGLPADPERDELISRTAREWAAKSPQDAVEWAGAIPDLVLRNRALAEVAVSWGAIEPVAALTLVVKSVEPGRQQEDAVVSIVQHWVQQQSEAAINWVMQLPAGELGNTAIREAVKLWAGQDPEQAGSWLNGLAKDLPGRDIAIGSFASVIAPQFPRIAVDWAVTIADKSLRERQIEQIAELWQVGDPTAARDWIASSSLPEDQKSRLLGLKSE